jgi:hypothetical protein
MSFIAITVSVGSKNSFVSCSSDNLSYFPNMKSTYNMANFVVDFRELHDRLIADGFELVSVAPAAANSMQHFYRRQHGHGQTTK